MKRPVTKRILSILICIALVIGYLPTMALAAASDSSNRVADPSTMDGWRDLFLPDLLTTNDAGAVWTDKSVFADAAAFDGTGITKNKEDSFLVALSAMASNMSVTGVANVPTDTVVILDLSSSMYSGSTRDPKTVQTMLTAVNSSIEKLQALNENNRVGVVVYYGGVDRNQSDANNSMVLLPLDRYSGTNNYLKATVSSGKIRTVAVNSGVKNSAGKTMPQTTRTLTDVAGTYAQLGLLDAMQQLLAADTTVPATADYQPGAARVPVVIFMSDGEPTAATHDYTKKVTAGMGNNTISIRSANETDFVTQLTAAYVRKMVDDHYAETDPLFYTLSLGNSVSLAVMDPKDHTPATIDGYWKKLLSDGKVNITVYNSPNGWGSPTVKKTYTVSQTTANGATFPSGINLRNYVDKAFTATTANQLTDAFSDIVNQISLVSKYTPTLVAGNADLSGYISFVDKIGEYMEVTDIKGVLIDDTLYSGAELARNFVAGGGNLGTYEDPTSLGDEMVWAVQARLGLKTADAARTLIGLAHEYGQLRYNSDTDYSNYIGWYANAAGEFLGFWHEGIQTMPEPTGDAATDPAFIIKSYGYLGKVDEDQGVAASDMMYATVQIRENIATGEQSMVFAVPAALIPVITYEVTLGIDGEMTDMKVSGAEYPIRLVYEVALQEQVNEFTMMDVVSETYLAANTNADGSVNFYTNQYEVDDSTGYGKVNTYSYFNPSRQNDKYYYLVDTPLYTDTNGTRYMGDAQPEGVFYRSYVVYTADGAQTLYRQISPASLATAKRAADGSWYIGAGNVHVNLDGYTVEKTENITDTLSKTYIPFVDAHNHSVGELGYNFIVGATLGNNGRLTLKPETGITLSKTMANGLAAPDAPFQFNITNVTDSDDDASYPAILVDADGQQTATTVSFTGGKATVEVAAGQTLYIGGLTAGMVYVVEEIQTLEYIPVTDSFTLALQEGQMAEAAFVNALRGEGNLLISKEVRHQLGSEHTIPEDLSFTIHVRLEGVGVAEQTFEAIGAQTSVTTDAQGCFTVTLQHDQQIQILNLPEGTTAYVTEPEPGAGFTATYQENGKRGDGVVIVSKDGASVEVINSYVPENVDPVNIVLYGTKAVDTAASDWNGAEFQFQLQKWTERGWVTIATATANESNPTFDFNETMSQEVFTAPGTYSYQVLETNGGQTIGGISYDATLHTFGVTVTDRDMDGKLEIDRVASFHTGNAFDIDEGGNWKIDIDFHNRYDATGCDVVLDVLKRLDNPSGSPLVSPAGFQFGLYDGTELVAVSELSHGAGEARFILHYELEDEGTHTYTLKEIIPDVKIPGMRYDETAYQVVVEVTDNSDGTMSAAVVSIDGESASAAPVFTNIYNPEDATLEIDFVDKKLTGRDLKPGEFHFELMGEDDRQHLFGTNDAKGNVVFDDVLRFDAVGTYRYKLQEVTTDGSGITTDKTVYTVLVTVTDENGVLTADYQIINLVGKEVLFQNTYTPKPVTYTLGGMKELTGRILLNNEFTFVLTEADRSGNVIGEWALTATNFMDGSFRFDPLTFSETGTYYYQISEKNSGSADYGIIFDETKYVVAITIDDDLEGNLFVSAVTTTVIGGEEVDSISFTNRYVPAPTSAQIPGNKNLIGKVLTEGAFRFELYEADEDWNQGEWLESKENDENGSFAFSTIDYDTAGTRYYLVKEANGGEVIDGVTYDDTVYRVEIRVTDNLRGQLVAQTIIYDDAGIPQDRIVFRNTYNVTGDATVTLNGTKELSGKPLSDGDFTFELYETDADFAVSGDPIQIATNVDGKFSMTLNYQAEDVGSTRYYVVMERNGGQTIDGIAYSTAKYYVTVEITDDGVGGINTETTITNGTDTVTSMDFVNGYTTEGTEVVLSGLKTMTGMDLNAGDFTFELYDAVSGDLLQTVVNDANGTFTFQAIQYTEPGVHYYLVKEANGGQTIDGVTYDDTVYRVEIRVTDNLRGQLVAQTIIYDDADIPQDRIVFRNTYNVTGDASVTLNGTKELNGKPLSDGDFTFELYETDADFAVSGDPIQTATNVDGKFSMTLSYLPEDVGSTRYYVVMERNGGQTIDGIAYSTAKYYVTVEITDDGVGGINTETTITNGTDTVTSLDFVNGYTTDEVEVVLNGLKTMTGMDLNAGDFTFELYDAVSGDLLQTVVNDANGTFTFQTIQYTEPGTYSYLVKEAKGGQTIDGVTYDDTVYRVEIRVTDNLRGQLVAQSYIYDDAGIPQDRIVFRNTYNVTGDASVILNGTKELNGKPLSDGDFTFELYETDADFAVSGDPIQTATNANGKFSMTLNYQAEDVGSTRYYVVMERNGGQTIDGIAYSTAKYYVTVEITDDGVGGINTETTITNGTDTVTSLDFVNGYTTESTEVVLNGLKTMTGMDLNAGDFTFQLYDAVSGDLIQTAVNDANGTFTFQAIKFAEPGTYSYLVKEANGGQTIDGVTYDDTVYRVEIRVTDNLRGQLVAQTIIYDDAGIPQDRIVFRNTYNVTGDATVTLNGTKELNGKPLSDGDFTFELYETDVDFVVSGDPIQTATNVDGKFAMTLNYLPEDVGSVRYYVVMERNGGQTIDGIAYSAAKYYVTVEITDDGVGGINTETTITNGTDTVTSLDFVNGYTTEGTEVVLSGLKTMTGMDLNAGDFTFELYDAVSGDLLQTAVNDANGTFTFPAIQYTEPGTYSYLVKEANGGEVIDGVIYDGTIYRITVEVTDNGLGALEYVLNITDGEGNPAQRVTFANRYVEPPPKTGDTSILLWVALMALSDGDFTFELYETDADFAVSGDPIQTATNANGKFAMTLNYQAEDVGSVRYYVVMERNGGQTIDGIAYSTAKYYVMVEITDDGVGGINTATTITNGTDTVTSMDFVNGYTTEGTEVVLNGLKTVTGMDLNAGDFTFELYDAVSGDLIQTAVNDANGTFTFQAIQYTEPGTYSYLVKEVNGGEVIDGVIFDGTIYHITVEVTDNGLGALEYVLNITDGEGNPAQRVTFANRYVEPPPKTGDTSILLWVALMAISCGAIVITMAFNKKPDETEPE